MLLGPWTMMFISPWPKAIDAMLAAIHEQTVSIAGAEYAELGVAMSATDALTKLEHRKEIEAQVLKLIQDIPQTEIVARVHLVTPW